jgi:hypothetical protein
MKTLKTSAPKRRATGVTCQWAVMKSLAANSLLWATGAVAKLYRSDRPGQLATAATAPWVIKAAELRSFIMTSGALTVIVQWYAQA